MIVSITLFIIVGMMLFTPFLINAMYLNEFECAFKGFTNILVELSIIALVVQWVLV